ncbi:hypothetical protein AOC36_09135 [Erysipelothrix larvae]|uniref:Serine/threonine protein phosphatase n=1 Tax=Erysipelothrix larvae TaxID=1514105 RepID=A0A0X8H185_9FIRM|nr:hypothetical protein AOC36_09135 [Erysipelothrix larvae]
MSTNPILSDADEVRIMIASDLHYLTPQLYSQDNETFMKMIRYSDGKMVHYAEEIVDSFINEVIETNPEVLILSGDLTFNGERLSHEALAQKLKRVKDAGISVFVIPGNHDFSQYAAFDYHDEGTAYQRADNTSINEFLNLYKDYGYSNYASMDQTSLSYRVILNDSVQLLFIDVNGNEKENVISDKTLTWIETQLIEAQQANSQVIVISHQNMVMHTQRFSNGFTIENNESLLNLFETYGVRLGFSGHLHIQDIATQSGFYDVASSSLSVLDHRYGILTIHKDTSLDYQTIPLTLDIPEDSTDFFNTISYWKGYEALEGYDFDKETKDAMLEFVVSVNEHYFRGDLYAFSDLFKASESYTRWTQLKYNAFGTYIESMLNQELQDENTLILAPIR